jgi:trans-aconitate 2-methyltransferase
MAEWDPVQYLRFSDERLRPALDLLGRVPIEAPRRVVDLGCGAGNISAILKSRFPAAEVVGVDSSAAMLDKARAAAPDCRFIHAGFEEWAPDAPVDLLFSNAALHWTGAHETLFPRLLSCLTPGGWLAVQMPAMHDAALRRLQPEIAAAGPWAPALRGLASAPPILAPGDYWDILKPQAASLDIWETIYLHALTGPDAVGEWAAGSSLRPFLDPLGPELRAGFRRAYGAAMAVHYPPRADGTTLLPFRRLFLLARR